MKSKLKNKLAKYIGDKAFYKALLKILVPIVIQNGITNLVSLLDNIMVGRLGTEQMSGVSIINQYIFVFNLLVFGVISAAGIFTAQYHGVKDAEGIRATFRTKVYMCLIGGTLGIAALAVFTEPLIGFFLYDGSAEGNLELTMQFGKDYIRYILIGLMPFALSSAISSTMRETGETVYPMIASFASVGTNFVLNGLLIFGLFGFPELGVVGAAIATVVSRFVELFILLLYALKSPKCAYFRGSFKTFGVPGKLLGKICISGLPLVANETLWALSITFRNQCYATRGLDAVAATNIASTINNLLSVVYLSMGTAISIIIGNLLGAGKLDEAEDTDRKIIAFNVVINSVTGLILVGIGFAFPYIYNTSAEARIIATFMIVVYGILSPFWAYINSTYFTIRSGGKVFQTMLSDSIFMWVGVVPVVYIAAYSTDMDIFKLYLCGTIAECFKALLGKFLLSRRTWLCQIVPDSGNSEAADNGEAK